MAKKSRFDLIVSANTKGALTAINKLKVGLKGLGLQAVVIPIKIARKGFDLGIKAVKASIKKLASFAKRTLQIGIGLAGVGAFVSTKAFADLEQLKLRLRSVSATAEESEKNFAEIFDFSKRTPFDPQELVSAFATLQGFGAGSVKALEAIGSASFASGKQISDVVAGLGGLSREVFIPLGIDVRNELQASGKAFVKFRDKAGKQLQFTANSAEELRLKLIEAFSVKFGGTLEKASETVNGLVSTVKGNLSVAFANVGEGFADNLKKALNTANDLIVRLSESKVLTAVATTFSNEISKALGFLKGASENLEEKIASVSANLIAGAKTFKDFVQGAFENFKSGNFSIFGDVIITAISGGATILSTTLIESFKTIVPILANTGTLMGQKIFDSIATYFIPYLKRTPEEQAKADIDFGNQFDKLAEAGIARSAESAKNIAKTTSTELSKLVSSVGGVGGIDIGSKFNEYKSLVEKEILSNIDAKKEEARLVNERVAKESDFQKIIELSAKATAGKAVAVKSSIPSQAEALKGTSLDPENIKIAKDLAEKRKAEEKKASEALIKEAKARRAKLLKESEKLTADQIEAKKAEEKAKEPTSRALRRAQGLDEPTSRALRRAQGLDEPKSRALKRFKGLGETTSKALKRAKELAKGEEAKLPKVAEKSEVDLLKEILESFNKVMGIA